jgi:signal transduction histidine kinase
LLLIILPLTAFMMAIAVGSIAVHERVMQATLAAESRAGTSSVALDLTLLAPLVLIAPLFVALAALWFGARQIVQPLQRLEAKASAVAAGDYGPISEPVGGISEVEHLQAVLADMAAKVRASQEGLRDYIGAITSAQEEERLRLARELHDDTIQELIALKQRLQLAQKGAEGQSPKPTFEELENLVEETIASVRRMTRALRPIYLEDLGLVTALEMLSQETSQQNGLQVEFQRAGREQRLPKDAELALYRIVQQALNNVVRHARARRAVVNVEFLDGEVSIKVSDDGVGFRMPSSPTDLAPEGHFGLLGMRERADLIGARLEVKTETGRGTTVSVHLPVKTA